MPKVFLVRKLRNQLKGNGTGFGTVTPPPSPEQEGLLNGQAAVQNVEILPSQEEPKDLVIQRRVPEVHGPASPAHDDDQEHDRSRSPSHWSESTHTPPVSPKRAASPLRPMSPQPLREEDISSASKSGYEVPTHGPYHRKKHILHFSVGPPAAPPSFFPVSVIKSPHEVAPTGSRARYAYEKYAERSAEARASVSPVASHFYDSGSESCSAVSPISYASNDQMDCEGPLDFRSRHSSRSLSPPPQQPYHPPIRLPESLRQVISPDSLEFVNGGTGIKNPLIHAHRNSEASPRVSSTSSSVCHSPTESYKSPSHRENRHADSNSDNNRLNCNICGKSFSLQRLLNRHMKCHSDQKRYICSFCGKGFNDTFDLKRHTRTHTGVRPYKCSLCEKSFTQRCSLESHTLKVHGIQHNYAYKERRAKVYVCEECGHTTNEPEVHYLHLKENHPFSPALLKFYDKRHFKFSDGSFPLGIIRVNN